nr:immunoglobulin light chain junction region [Macaca mulatta]MOY05225.1 immunoglobulin light chain junction region [Macaca mulatta]MOY05632.1 immunoglobulin light chain junction region [Macaca mulatta]MOY05667.1 immunoglobulin light chain junction region [Macaca mulatta]MOY05785.1 immunoglobulin light chain junction region [Macaca mulatta]
DYYCQVWDSITKYVLF